MTASGLTQLRLVLAAVITGAHLWLAPFTFMNPPEPVWVHGLSDDADSDDILLLEMALTAIVDTNPALEAIVQPLLVLERTPEQVAPSTDPPRARQIRAPPPV